MCKTETGRLHANIQDHQALVKKLGQFLVNRQVDRMMSHDASKFSPEEFPYFAKIYDELRKEEYGSPRSIELLRSIRPALDHHQANNRHHPEFHEDGVCGMTLIDILEMFVDWIAASQRNPTPNVYESISRSCERFEIPLWFEDVFHRTAKLFQEAEIIPADPK